MDYWNAHYAAALVAKPVPTFKAEQFEQMVKEQRVDCVIVTSIDRTHHEYITRALRLGCDAVTEKPMTIDAAKCQQILDTIRSTGKKVTVTFNYRYAPRNAKVKELLLSGVIGRVNSVHFEWLLDTRHGADYFRRWHREKANSGGLMVHKATHHFDLVNWWLGASPKTVFAQGDLTFYGRANAEARGERRGYERAHAAPEAQDDPFALHLDRDDKLRALYLDAEHEDGYFRDRSVFADGITIEDDVAVLVRYRDPGGGCGATMSYHLTAYAPWEGFRVAFNGTKGRLEYEVEESSYVSGSTTDSNAPELIGSKEHVVSEPTRIIVRPHWARPYLADVPGGESGHGGGDKRLLADVFGGAGAGAGGAPRADPLGQRADHVAGARSILVGIAANESMQSGRPVEVDRLVNL
jgi:predicted dehydrogenase